MLEVIHNKKIFPVILLLIIVFYGAFLRIDNLADQSYWIDEGYTLNAVMSTLEKGYPILDSGESYGRSLLNTYLIAGAVKLGGFNPAATRSVAVVFGIATIILVYFLGKRFFNELVGLGAAALTSFSYWEITWSRQARMYSQLQFFFLLSIYLFDSLLEKFSYKKLTFLILTTIATILSHFFGFFLLAIYLIIGLIKLYSHKKSVQNFFETKKNKMILGLLVLILAPTIGNLIFKLINQVIQTQFFSGLHYQMFLLNFLPLITTFALVGILIAVFTFKKDKIVSLITLILAYLIPYIVITFSTEAQHYRYLFFILPILLIFATYTLWFIAQLFKPTKALFAILLVILVLASTLLVNRTFVFASQEKYYLESFTPQPNFVEAYEVVKKNGWDENKIIISPYTQMDKVYLGRSNYWLAIDLLGHRLDMNSVPEKEYYNNAITIKTAEQLQEIIKQNSGYLVVDDMAYARLSDDINTLIETLPNLFYDLREKGSRIWVFGF